MGACLQFVATQLLVGRGGRKRQRDVSGAAEGHVNLNAQVRLVQAAPRHAPGAGGAGVRALQAAQAPAGNGRHGGTAEAGLCRHGTKASGVGKEPLNDGAIGVVVHRVHADAGDDTVVVERVPALPDGGGAKLDLAEPAGVTLIGEQVVGLGCHAGLTEGARQEVGSHKAGDELVLVARERAIKNEGVECGRAKAKGDAEGVGSLRGHGATAVGREVLGVDVVMQVLGKLVVVGCVGLLAEHAGCVGNLAGAAPPVQVSNEVGVGGARAVVLGSIEGQPVTQLVQAAPQVLLTLVRALDVVDPGGHGVVVLRENGGVAAHEVALPRDEAGCVAPDSAGGAVEHERGGNERSTALVLGRFLSHVVGKLAIERLLVGQVECGWREDLGVASPAHALVALRAVGGGVHEVALHAPTCILNQTVHQLVARGEGTSLFKVRVQHQAGEVLRLERGNPLDFDEAIAVVGEARFKHVLGAIAHVNKLLLGAAEVVVVELAVLQQLAELHANGGAGRLVDAQAEGACELLAHVEDKVAGGYGDHGGGEGLMRSYREREAIGELSGGGCGLCGLEQLSCDGFGGGQGVIHIHTVVDVGARDVGAGHQPAFARGEDLRGTVSVRDMQLGDESPVVAIEAAVLGDEAKAALPPAIAHEEGEACGLTGVTQLFGHVVGLDLQPAIIGVGARGKVLGAYALAIDACVIEAQATGVEASGGNLAREGEIAVEDGVTRRLRTIARQPLGRPRFIHLAGLEGRDVGGRLLVGVGAHGNGPLVTRARLQGHVDIGGDRVKLGPPGVCHGDAFARYHDARGGCSGALGILDSPGEDSMEKRKAKRIAKVIYVKVGDVHYVLPMCCTGV